MYIVAQKKVQLGAMAKPAPRPAFGDFFFRVHKKDTFYFAPIPPYEHKKEPRQFSCRDSPFPILYTHKKIRLPKGSRTLFLSCYPSTAEMVPVFKSIS